MIRSSCTPGSTNRGLTLLELMLALALSGLLILGLVQIVSAASAAGQLQENQAQLLDRARFAASLLGTAVRGAGFRPQPWEAGYAVEAIGANSADAVSARSDRLTLRDWSDRNCFGNRNPEQDSEGHPRFFFREQSFDLNGSDHLTRSCRYGPGEADLVTQVRRQGVVPGVESFQVMYGEDADRDGNIERWVVAGAWNDPRGVLGVRVGLLLASANRVTEPAVREYDLPGGARVAVADGRLREVMELTFALRGRSG